MAKRGSRFPKLTKREKDKFLRFLQEAQNYAEEEREKAKLNVPNDPTPRSAGEIYYFTAFVRAVKWMRSVANSVGGDGGRKNGTEK